METKIYLFFLNHNIKLISKNLSLIREKYNKNNYEQNIKNNYEDIINIFTENIIKKGKKYIIIIIIKV